MVNNKDLWFVFGGEFTDGTCSEMVPSTGSVHGPFENEMAAEKAMDGLIRWKIDVCWHRFWVTKVSTWTG